MPWCCTNAAVAVLVVVVVVVMCSASNFVCISRDVWNKFLEFEANIGDLTSIVKVEKRRIQALGSVRSSATSLPI